MAKIPKDWLKAIGISDNVIQSLEESWESLPEWERLLIFKAFDHFNQGVSCLKVIIERREEKI